MRSAISFAWEIHKESFLENNTIIDELKLRFGYGETGNQRVGDNLTAVNYRISPEGYAANGTLLQAFEKTNIPNTELTWETQKQFNAGIDLSLFENRMNLTVDAYDKNSDDLLNTLSIGGSSVKLVIKNYPKEKEEWLEASHSRRPKYPILKNRL